MEKKMVKAVRLVNGFTDDLRVRLDRKSHQEAIRNFLEENILNVFGTNVYEKIGVKAVICTDISKDGAMKGTNLELYKELSDKYSLEIVASGGVSSMDDVLALKEIGVWGAIIGKAYYTGAIDLKEAIEVSK